MQIEEELHDAEWRAEHYASAAERRRTRNAALDMLVAQWETLDLTERQQLLREHRQTRSKRRRRRSAARAPRP